MMVKIVSFIRHVGLKKQEMLLEPENRDVVSL